MVLGRSSGNRSSPADERPIEDLAGRTAAASPPPHAKPPVPPGASRFVRVQYTHRIGAWRSLVARTVRVGEVPGSNPGAPITGRPRIGGAFLVLRGHRRDLPTRQPANEGARSRARDEVPSALLPGDEPRPVCLFGEAVGAAVPDVPSVLLDRQILSRRQERDPLVTHDRLAGKAVGIDLDVLARGSSRGTHPPLASAERHPDRQRNGPVQWGRSGRGREGVVPSPRCSRPPS